MRRFTGILFIVFFTCGCAAYKLDSAQSNLRSSFASGDYSNTVQLMESLEKKSVYKEKDQVLLDLEQGLVNHFAGNYKESSQYFKSAEYEIEDLFSKSITRALKSFAFNDNTLAYDGEDYEDIYLNVFNSLNYIHLNDLESALVEARRVTFKLGQLDQKYNGLVQALSQADTTSTGSEKWKTGKSNFENSAMARYLSTILYAKTNKPDDARIEYENLLKAYQDQPSLYNIGKQERDQLRILTEPDSYNVMIKAFAGRAPIKIQNDIRFYDQESDTYLKFSLPQLKMYESRVHSIEMHVGNQPAVSLKLIEEMDRVAKDVYKVKEPIIYARTLVRVALKAVAAKKLEKESKKKDDTFGDIMNVMGKIAQEATEKADLRSWQTMPGKAYGTVIKLSPGEHDIRLEYKNAYGTVLKTDQHTITVDENEQLELVESIYWN